MFLAACQPTATAAPVEPLPAEAPIGAELEACAVPPTALAWAGEAGDCGVALIGDQRPRLTELEGEREWPVVMPEACGADACDFTLAETSLGVLVVATRRSPTGESPSWVGMGLELGGAYRFVDLWVGESVLDDLTPNGPPHALAPHDCGGKLALLVVPRLGGAHAERPEPALVAAAGIPHLEGEVVVVEPVEAGGCSELDVPLP